MLTDRYHDVLTEDQAADPRIRSTPVKGGHVRTVRRGGYPVQFETCFLSAEGQGIERDERFPTEGEALAYHQELVNEIARAGLRATVPKTTTAGPDRTLWTRVSGGHVITEIWAHHHETFFLSSRSSATYGTAESAHRKMVDEIAQSEQGKDWNVRMRIEREGS